ncbi:MAG: OmpH family outer membrane protein [Endomicrobiia bacterium]
MKKWKIFFAIFSIFFQSRSFSLELTSKDITVIRIGVVDIEKILANYDFAKKWDENFQSFKTAKQSLLMDMEKELDDLVRKKISLRTEVDQLQMQLEQLEKTYQQKVEISTVSVSTSSGTIENLDSVDKKMFDDKCFPIQYEENINQLKNTILTKQRDFDEITKSVDEKKEQIKNKKQLVEEEILQYKDKIEAEIYAHLYGVIEKVAKQEKLNIVIEKSGILYGLTEIDITDKILKLLK